MAQGTTGTPAGAAVIVMTTGPDPVSENVPAHGAAPEPTPFSTPMLPRLTRIVPVLPGPKTSPATVSVIVTRTLAGPMEAAKAVPCAMSGLGP